MLGNCGAANPGCSRLSRRLFWLRTSPVISWGSIFDDPSGLRHPPPFTRSETPVSQDSNGHVLSRHRIRQFNEITVGNPRLRPKENYLFSPILHKVVQPPNQLVPAERNIFINPELIIPQSSNYNFIRISAEIQT